MSINISNSNEGWKTSPAGSWSTFCAQPPATPTSACNRVVIRITADVLVPNYHMFYDGPINSFQPTYQALADGSLIAPPFSRDLYQGDCMLLFIGPLLLLFLRNCFLSADYIRRRRVRFQSLFYALLASQLLGLAAFAIDTSSFLMGQFNCRM